VKLRALMKMLDRLQPVQKREAGVTADVLVSMIDRMKNDTPLSKRYSIIASCAYNALGRIALIEGTEESARRTEAHFENQLRANEAIGNAEGIATAKGNIVYAKSMYEGGNNNEELLNSTHDVYKLRAAEYGEKNDYTIRAGKILAMSLQNANCWGEARELLTKLLATSKQVYSAHHNTTKEIVPELKKTKARERVTRFMTLHETGSINSERWLNVFQDVYEFCFAQLGEEHEQTFNAGKLYALNLQKADRAGEASELFAKLLATSTKVLGPHHNITKEIALSIHRLNGISSHVDG